VRNINGPLPTVADPADTGMKRSAPVKAYWWCERPNFGDALAPLLLERFAGIKAEWARPEQAQVVCVGSVLERLPPFWTVMHFTQI
jgi:hypothetical protein